mgnify:CR=1 FL=1
MIFIETPIFTKLVKDLLPDDEYKQLQEALLLRPDAGNIIPSSGGLYKVRWRIPGKGKRGGIRIIYYWHKSEDRLYMLTAYKKSKQEDLTQSQLAILRKVVEEWLK